MTGVPGKITAPAIDMTHGGGGFVDPKDKSRAYYPSIGNPGSMGLLEFKVDLKTGESKLTAVRYRYPDPHNDVVSYGGYPTRPIFFPGDMIPVGSHGGITPAQTFYFKGYQYFTDSYNTYWYNQSPVTTLWILEDGICRPIASSGWVGTGPHRWQTRDEPEIKEKIDMCKWYASTESLSSIARSHTRTLRAAPRSPSIWGRSRIFPHHEIPMESSQDNVCAVMVRLKLVIRHESGTRLVEAVIPWSEIPEVYPRIHSGKTVKFSCCVSDNKGLAHELAQGPQRVDYQLHHFP